MTDAPDEIQFERIVDQVRHLETCPDPMAHGLVLKGLTVAERILRDGGPSMTAVERDAWLDGVRTLHLAGLAAIGPPKRLRY